jgi:hypothetical protein
MKLLGNISSVQVLFLDCDAQETCKLSLVVRVNAKRMFSMIIHFGGDVFGSHRWIGNDSLHKQMSENL